MADVLASWFTHTPERQAPTRRRAAAKKRRAPKRQVNYASANRGRSNRLQDAILALLNHHDGMTLREIGEAVGISRQLARYHVLKLIAHRQLLAVVEACEANGGVQFRVWEHASLAAAYTIECAQRGMAA
jgi:hypothetical protein